MLPFVCCHTLIGAFFSLALVRGGLSRRNSHLFLNFYSTLPPYNIDVREFLGYWTELSSFLVLVNGANYQLCYAIAGKEEHNLHYAKIGGSSFFMNTLKQLKI